MNGNDHLEKLSIEVTDLPHGPAIRIMDQQINHRIALDNMQFGQTRPWLADEDGPVNNNHWTKTIKWLGVIILLLLALFGCYYLVPNVPLFNIKNIPVYNTLIPVSSDGSDQDMKEENNCFCPNTIVKNDGDISIGDEMIIPFTYDEPNIESMFKETSGNEDIDVSTCAFYDMFSYLFNQLCSLKDNIIARIPPEPPDDIYSIYDSNKKIELDPMLATIDQLFVSAIEHADRTDTQIQKEIDSVCSNEECAKENVP